MPKHFDYNEVPLYFMHCTNTQCTRADHCMRQKVMQHITAEPLKISVINPLRIPQDTDNCPHFYPDNTTKFALGITHLLDNIPHTTALTIKKQLSGYFSKSNYYRIRSKERLITPEEQKLIRQLFIDNGIEAEPRYDEYVEKYQW